MRIVALFFSIIGVLIFPSFVFAEAGAPVAGRAAASRATASRATASRLVNGEVLYYSTLHEAFAAAGGASLDNPDEITLLADAVLDEPISMDSEKHIRLIAGNGARTIRRGAVIDYPILWIRGDNASLTLGAPIAEGEEAGGALTIDGGYRNEPAIEARAPLIVVNGQAARLIMETGVTLQNNYNSGAGAGTSIYENGGCVFVRTRDNLTNLAAFIMKGGVIQGNINDTQNTFAFGGGVTIIGLGLFVMEGGEIRGNTAYFAGGGFCAGSRGSFKKTGGVIYGKDAPRGLRNTAINGTGAPPVYAHALNINLPEEPIIQFRDDTVGEDETLSYEGKYNGRNGVFGEGENWERPGAIVPRSLLIALFACIIFALTGVLVFLILRTRRKKPPVMSASGAPALLEKIQNLTPREKETFDLLLTDISLKEIANNLDISYSGANFHVQRIYRKFGIQSRTELFALFQKNHSVNED